MGSKFELSVIRRQGILRLHMKGDLDSDAVNQLLNVLNTDNKDVALAMIDTDGLEVLDSSRKDSLQRMIHSLGDFRYRLVFTGPYSSQLIPAWAEWS